MGAAPDFDVAVVGAGPAGLAAAIRAAAAGLSVVVLEKADGPPDKACGEGLMPGGVRALEALGARGRLAPGASAPFSGIRYVLPNGTCAEGRLATPGLGIRRTALAAALAARAGEHGVEIRWGCAVEAFATGARHAALATAAGEVTAGVLVVADGLRSRLRRLAGLDRPPLLPPRLGVRQHFRVSPWSNFVEVHLAEGMQAFVTPVGPACVNVAVLWDSNRVASPVSLPGCLRRFPAIAERLAGATADSAPRGAGPLGQGARSVVAHRLVLVGDAAGSVDAISGAGVSLALASARALGEVLPDALRAGATRKALGPYECRFRRAFGRYAVICRLLLVFARRRTVQGAAVTLLARHPGLFSRLLTAAAS